MDDPEPRALRDTRLKLIVEVEDNTGERGVFTRTFRSHQQVRSVLQWLRSLGDERRVHITSVRVVE